MKQRPACLGALLRNRQSNLPTQSIEEAPRSILESWSEDSDTASPIRSARDILCAVAEKVNPAFLTATNPTTGEADVHRAWRNSLDLTSKAAHTVPLSYRGRSITVSGRARAVKVENAADVPLATPNHSGAGNVQRHPSKGRLAQRMTAVNKAAPVFPHCRTKDWRCPAATHLRRQAAGRR